MTEPTAELQQEEPAGPAPMMAGTFAIYPDDGGGLVLVADIAGRGVTRKRIPGTLVSILSGESGGPVANMVRKALGQ